MLCSTLQVHTQAGQQHRWQAVAGVQQEQGSQYALERGLACLHQPDG